MNKNNNWIKIGVDTAIRWQYFLLPFFLSLLLLVFFFNKVVVNPNHCFFGISGDGMQVYYNTWYHVLYNKTTFASTAMNYPYTESVFFTGSNPLLTSFIKLFGLQYYTIAIINLSMLLSIPVASGFIGLIFKEYKVSIFYASIAATAIAFLSPQIDRMHAHFNLSYVFAIPVIIYLILKFFKAPSIKKSVLIAIVGFVLACTHMYLFMFSLVIILSVWVGLGFIMPIKKYFVHGIKHFFIQALLPYVLIKLCILMAHAPNDRTNAPFGFFDYYSGANGVFYPFGRCYATLFELVGLKPEANYEGVAFVGVIASLFVLFLLLKFVFHTISFQYKRALNITGDYFLNILLLCAIIMLVFSFCIPFKYEEYRALALKLDFIKQFRALGRFTWMFFYVINIIVIIYISSLQSFFQKFKLKQLCMSIALIGLSYDAYCNIKNIKNDLNNKHEYLLDIDNVEKQNSWVKEIIPSKFQSILPLPYFHVGSELFSYPINHELFDYACTVSLKTGLPMMSVYNSRISLSETFKSIQLFKEPTGKMLDVINDLKNNKDILIVVKPELCNTYETELLSYAKLILKTKHFELHRLAINDLKKHYSNWAKKTIENFALEKSNLFSKNGCYLSDTLHCFETIDFINKNNFEGFADKGVFKQKIVGYTTVASMQPKYKSATKKYTLSFWMKSLNKDILPRTGIDIKATNSINETYSVYYSQVMHSSKQIHKDWTLIEQSFKLQSASDKIDVVLWNEEIKNNEEFYIDNLMLRADTLNVYKVTDSCIYKNNRIYFIK